MKKGIVLTLLVALFTSMSASNQTAIDYYLSGDIKTAKERFAQTEKLDALDNYYLGLISIKENDLDKAKAYFNAGLALDPNNVYNKIGLATLQMPKNQKAIIKHVEQYKKAQPEKQFRKNPETYLNNCSWLDEVIYSSTPKMPTKKSSALPPEPQKIPENYDPYYNLIK